MQNSISVFSLNYLFADLAYFNQLRVDSLKSQLTLGLPRDTAQQKTS